MQSVHQHVSLMPVLATALDALLKGYLLLDAFAPGRDEAVLVFSDQTEALSLKLNTEAKTGLLFFYEHRLERSGSVYPLFRQLTNATVVRVFAHNNNRSFAIDFDNGMQLVFKLYGPLSNLVLFEAAKVAALSRQSIENDWLLKQDGFDVDDNGNEPLTQPLHYYVYAYENARGRQLAFTVEPTATELLFDSEVLFEALSFFSGAYLAQYNFNERKQALVGSLKQALKRQQALLNNAQTRLQYLQTEVPLAEVANILMANLHRMKKGDMEATLHDFYRDVPITIKLKKEWSPNENAEHFYKKAKNRKREWAQAEAQIAAASVKVEQLGRQLREAINIVDHRALRITEKDAKPGKLQGGGNQKHADPASQFKQFSFNGYSIFVGKSSANNDQLTLKFAHNNDLWLHARGVSGSHVLIKHKSKDALFPVPVIEFAAKLAAYYSKAKSSALVPVMYTQKKFVRKPKGALAGQVKVEREEVMMVEPGLPGEGGKGK